MFPDCKEKLCGSSKVLLNSNLDDEANGQAPFDSDFPQIQSEDSVPFQTFRLLFSQIQAP
jgi:hypothetical protein